MERYVAQETTTPVARRVYVRRSGMRSLRRAMFVSSPMMVGRKIFTEDVEHGEPDVVLLRYVIFGQHPAASSTPVWETSRAMFQGCIVVSHCDHHKGQINEVTLCLALDQTRWRTIASCLGC